MRIMILGVILLLMYSVCEAKQKFNPLSGEWETVPDNYTENRFNPFDGSWSYQPKEAKKEFNTFSGRWEWDSGHQGREE